MGLELDDNHSVWLLGRPDYEALPSLEGEITADVAIIGGGFTGVSTALHLIERRPGLGVVLVEARTLANGASGRNGGQMLNWINGVSHHDPALAKKVFAITHHGIEGIIRVIQQYGLDVRWKRQGAMEVYTNPARADAAAAEVEQLRSVGLPMEFITGAALDERLRLTGARGAVLDPTAGQLNGADYLRALRPVLLDKGVRIYENTPVQSIKEGATVTLTTPAGRIRAGAIVLATNGYTGQLGYFRDKIFPLHSHAVAVGPVQGAEIGWGPVSAFCDDLDRIAYGAMTSDGYVVFGGGSNAAYAYLYGGKAHYPGAPDSAKTSFDAVESCLYRYMPGLKEKPVVRRWTGTLGVTFNRQCTMGVQGEHKNVYYALGYSGHGVTLANLAGEVLTDLYLDNHEPWKDAPFYQNALPYIPPDPFRWVGYHVYAGLTGRSPRRG